MATIKQTHTITADFPAKKLPDLYALLENEAHYFDLTVSKAVAGRSVLILLVEPEHADHFRALLDEIKD